ncbi:MAG: alkaline phosphatase family protein [Candidatus Sumerlaeota bacterium]|nr:alkaline phosphatase family protein [Candidatus Sumerlaeota bacterium]
MLNFLRKSKKRVCVIGLDGMPHSLLSRFIDSGVMPTMAELTKAGAMQKMRVSLPEISAVSWTTFMTGANPGQHGIFGFLDLKPGTKEIRFPSFRDVKVPTFWDRLGEKGKRCLVLDQPSTYPARPIPGALISGFVALDLRKAVDPPSLFVDLKRINYELDIDTQRARVDSAYLMQALDATLEQRRAALDLLWDREDWDFVEVVVTGTDRLQHYLWKAIEDTNHPYHSAVLDYYRKVDGFIAEVIERFQKKAGGEEAALQGLMLLSDHGFTGIKKEFNLSRWLMEESYQVFLGEGKPTLATLAPQTKAFALDPNRIYFNRTSRFPDGRVEDSEVPALIAEVSERLLSLQCDGELVVSRVERCADIYSGPQTPHGPDLVVVTRYGYDAKGALGKPAVFTDTDLQGMHTWDDAFVWSAEPLGEYVNIVDLAGHIEARLTE